MPKFHYRGLNAQGQQQKGEIEAASQQSAIEALRGRNITPTELGPLKDPVTIEGLLEKYRRAPISELVLLTRQMATLIEAGVTVLNALTLLEEQTDNQVMKRTLRAVCDDIEAGSSLSDALARHPKIFSSLYVATIKAGEESGTLDESLRQLAVAIEREQRMRRQIKSATRYPFAVIIIAALAVLLALIVVVPRFEAIFLDLGAELPGITKLLLAASDLFVPEQPYLLPVTPLLFVALIGAGLFLAIGMYRVGWMSITRATAVASGLVAALMVLIWTVQNDPSWLMGSLVISLPGGSQLSELALSTSLPTGVIGAPGWIVTPVRVLLFVAFLFSLRLMWRAWLSTPEGRYTWDRFRLNTPGKIGSLVQKVSIARFTRTLSTLLRAGVPVLTALDIVKETSGNLLIEEAIDRAREQVAAGSGIAAPLAASNLFPLMVTRMIAVGEQTGALEQMLEKSAIYYEEEVDVAMKNFQAIIEPFLIVMVGVIVGFLLFALYMPVFSVYGAYTAA